MKFPELASGLDLSLCAKQALGNSAIEGHEISDAQAAEAIEEAKRMIESGEAAAMLAKFSAPAFATELEFDEVWNALAVSNLIRSKCQNNESPAVLYVGRKEAALLRTHLAEMFGIEAVTTLRDTYYMGLEVVEVEVESLISTGGHKTIRTLSGAAKGRSALRDRETEVRRQFRI